MLTTPLTKLKGFTNMHCFIEKSEYMNDISLRSLKLVVMAKVGLMAQFVLTDSFLPHTCGPSADTTVDSILQEFRDDFLSNVNAKECAPELRRQKVIAEGTETDIEQAKDAGKARGVLYDHLQLNCNLEQLVVFSEVLMKADGGHGRTRDVGKRLHARIQEIARDQTVSPDESPLHPPPPKAEVNTGKD